MNAVAPIPRPRVSTGSQLGRASCADTSIDPEYGVVFEMTSRSGPPSSSSVLSSSTKRYSQAPGASQGPVQTPAVHVPPPAHVCGTPSITPKGVQSARSAGPVQNGTSGVQVTGWQESPCVGSQTVPAGHSNGPTQAAARQRFQRPLPSQS
jgi:hypothetical protein